ncbi:Uma2 family endonuclease [Nonomuraea sp. FMUSA5-5]|uniref:Uma2 family endonuclease n=1 Tax=Nonomuraea composti TaxID=2720023 RepID=A0ABX1BGV5_9ACTN|nr:Uma2 family endonuclease [Nonomuraea sp. FMUSA5-5]NJP95810.1 Uma2 family endonuclease [Nonomuraea sp. FMUSA5-5]
MATIEPAGRPASPYGDPPFTVDDLLKFPEDGNRYELFDGNLLVSSAPTILHQVAITNAMHVLLNAAPRELLTLTNVNFRVSDKDYYIPDLVVVPRSAALRGGLMFSPRDMLLAGEVVSPSTQKQDKSLKAVAYAEAGVPAYWRFELNEGPTLYVYELNGDSYDPPTAYKAGTTARLTWPFPVRFDPAQLLD